MLQVNKIGVGTRHKSLDWGQVFRSSAKCRVLHFDHNTPRHPDGKGPWCTDGQAADYEPAVCPGGQEGQWHPGLYQEWCGEQDEGSNPAPVLGIGEASPQVLCSVLGTSV